MKAPSRLLTCNTIGSDKQLQDILASKARAAGFSKHRCRSSDLLASKSAVSASDGTSAHVSLEVRQVEFEFDRERCVQLSVYSIRELPEEDSTVIIGAGPDIMR